MYVCIHKYSYYIIIHAATCYICLHCNEVAFQFIEVFHSRYGAVIISGWTQTSNSSCLTTTSNVRLRVKWHKNWWIKWINVHIVYTYVDYCCWVLLISVDGNLCAVYICMHVIKYTHNYTISIWPGWQKSTMWVQITLSYNLTNIFSSECMYYVVL